MGKRFEVVGDGGVRTRGLPDGGDAGLVAIRAPGFDELSGGPVQLFFGRGVGRCRDRCQGVRALERPVEQFVGSRDLVDQPAGVRGRRSTLSPVRTRWWVAGPKA